MFGFEWNEKEEREALLEAGEARGEARGIAIGETRGIAIGETRGIAIGETRGEARGRISSIRDLLSDGLITMEALKASGRYSPEELAAISKP